MDKAGLKPSGRPIAVFIESDDTGFRYRAGYPIDSAPEGKTALSEAVKVGVTPSGKAMRFQHLGAYADIDATYDAITAYLDEKGIDAQDSFVEEYANDVKDVGRSQPRGRHLRAPEIGRRHGPSFAGIDRSQEAVTKLEVGPPQWEADIR